MWKGPITLSRERKGRYRADHQGTRTAQLAPTADSENASTTPLEENPVTDTGSTAEEAVAASRRRPPVARPKVKLKEAR